jgi:hypothetical protein
MVEFAFVGVLLVILLFGIINMGVLLSFKQNLTQAASESARAGIAVVDDPSTTAVVEPYGDERYEVVDKALNDTVADHGKSCGQPGERPETAISESGMTCLRKIHDCSADTSNFAAIAADRADGDCLTVRITYDNRDPHRLMPAFPLIAMLEPDSMSSQTTVRLVPVS